jgi:two-component system, OmpR family, phosphate regulon sensor histidine kinase PhoR
MSLASDENGVLASRVIDWLVRARLILAAALVVFGALWAFGFIALAPALAGFVLIGAAALGMVAHGVAAREASAPVAPLAGASEEALVEAVLSGLADAVVALDPHGTVVALNARANVLAPALRRGEPISLGLRNPEVLDAIRRAGANGTVERAEFIVRTPVECWYEVVAVPVVPVSDAAGRLILTTFHDLTPLRRVEEMRADFVANASHELRTPLAALSGFIDTLRGPARNDPLARDRFLGIMEAQANRMARLIGDLLSLSRIELNEHRRPDAEVDLVAIVRQVIDGLQTLARDREVEVRLSVSAERVMVRGDRDELIRLLENLVENALKYAASGKRLDITLSQPSGREVSLAVRDYGPGIAPDHLPRLTERFYRVDVTESRAQGGTGLGLALVKHIANRHGGRLTIESVLGRGATFTVHLPALSSRR